MTTKARKPRKKSTQSKTKKVGAVLVLGGGVGAIQASLDLAESGFLVYIVESSPAIGGVMAQLDKTFPTNDCSMCILSPKLVEAGRHRNINLMTYSELESVEGEVGNFKVKVRKRARSVIMGKCTGCGTCQEKCPWKTDSEFDEGLGKRKAIYVPYAQAVPNVPVIDRDLCAYFQKGKCKVCQKVCPAEAIDFEQQDEIVDLDVGSIILAAGLEEFDAKLKPEFGFGRYPNVVTSIQFERMLCASGPLQGHLKRPSDGREPERIAFIQCIGSRDASIGRPYCSSVCCTYAIKEAIIAREHSKNIKSTIFCMDLRTYGKDFDKYQLRAKNEYGVRFLRSISAVEQDAKTSNLILRYESEAGGLVAEEFDLVVLSVGLGPPSKAVELGQKLGIELNEYNFVKTDPFTPVQTSRPGIFVCGVFQGPKDIPETVMQASGAAAGAGAALASVRGSLVKEAEYPAETDVAGQEPRIGAFICHCGINIGGYVDVPQVAEYAKTLPGVVFAENSLYTCSQDAQERIKAIIKEHNLNRVVVASCTPRTHEPLFQQTIREAGLNSHLFEMANIRDQCSWVHMNEKEAATEKAKDLVRMAVAKARLLRPLTELKVGVIHKGLVIGGGIAGMTAALELAAQGFECFLLEKERELGGNSRRVYRTLEGADVQELVKNTIKRVEDSKLIQVFASAAIKEIDGFVGNFKTTVVSDGQEHVLEHGVVIVACGGGEYKPTEYLYGKSDRVLTQLELEQRLATGSLPAGELNNVVMIQCVGSRNKARPYCSRICCSQAVKNAREIRKQNPRAKVYILYRDMRTYGFKEDFFRKAKEEGVRFVRFDEDHEPQLISENGKLRVEVLSLVLKKKVAFTPDLLVLSVGILPPSGREELAKALKVPCNEDGFFLEAHVKLRPVEFATEGVFVCGLAHSPKPLSENIGQAQAAAAKAAVILSKESVVSGGYVAEIDKSICQGCALCAQACCFGAITYNKELGVSEVNQVLCKGCGNCAAMCPSGACQIAGFRDEQILSQVKAYV